MKEEEMLYCLIAFILGWLVSRQMGNGFSVGCPGRYGRKTHTRGHIGWGDALGWS